MNKDNQTDAFLLDSIDNCTNKLEDPSVKAFFLVNPSNPASHALSQDTIEKLKKVVEKNPNLIIQNTFSVDFNYVI